VLIAGPPGAGKTTLAHVVAQHCGYRTQEVNASDDRSARAMKEVLEKGLNGHGVGLDRRPSLLVLDEIDGIEERAAVDVLVNLLKAPLRQRGGAGKRRSKRAAAQALTRPLICICNDPYAPALRELRQHCKLLYLDGAAPNRVVERLKVPFSLSLPPLSLFLSFFFFLFFFLLSLSDLIRTSPPLFTPLDSTQPNRLSAGQRVSAPPPTQAHCGLWSPAQGRTSGRVSTACSSPLRMPTWQCANSNNPNPLALRAAPSQGSGRYCPLGCVLRPKTSGWTSETPGRPSSAPKTW
jgi:hypothetical protein